MRLRRLPLGVLFPVALLVLLSALAGLQYSWIGTVSEAERDAMRESLDRDAGEFAADFDREIVRVYQAFFREAERLTPDEPEPIAARLDEWRAGAPFPDLVHALYYVEDETAGATLLAYSPDTRSFHPAEWSGPIERAKRHVLSRSLMRARGATGAGGASGTFMSAVRVPSVLPDVPAIVLPVRRLAATMAADADQRKTIERRTQEVLEQFPAAPRAGAVITSTFEVVGVSTDHAWVIVLLDDAVIREKMLPMLVDRHFGDSERVRLVIVDQELKPVLTRGIAGDRAISASPDAMAPLFFLRPDLMAASAVNWTILPGTAATALAVRAKPSAELQELQLVMERSTGAPTTTRATLRLPGWRVHLQHAAGSLDAAVAQVRTRNLWLSFGILATLAVSVGLIVFNARRSEKLAAQQMDFVATVSHELRTPLAVIRSAAQNLSAGVVHGGDQAKRYGELIETEGRRLTDMVEQVLEYAGLNANRAARVARVDDPGEIVRDAIDSCAPLHAGAGFTIDVSIAPSLPALLADEGALRRAIGNLIGNAIKYGSDGRWIGVTAQGATTRGRQEVQVAVADRGRGIDPQDLPHLFEPFYRGRQAAERQIHGNGLGLSLVKRIAESHGGRVSVKSTPGEGATFVLHLPAAPPERAEAVGAMAPHTTPS